MSTYATDTFAGAGLDEFTLTFKYISRDHVEVFRIVDSDGAETTLNVITTGVPTGDEYIWESDTKIKIGTALIAGQTIKIQRDTPEDQQIVDWSDGSYLIAEDLNDSDLQWLYNIQELEDRFASLDSEAIKYRGTIDLTVDAAPATPQNGDFYINSGSGTVVASWTGIAGDTVTGSEQVIYNSALSEWELLKTPASQKGVLSVTGTAPIQVDNTDAQRPVVSVDAATTTAAGVINEAASDNITYGRENGAWVAVANTAVGTSPPADPTNGDGWYDLNAGRLFLWVNDGDSSQWAEANPGISGGGGASVEVDDTPPTSPSEGDLWWDSSNGSGRLYVWYADGDSDQWVEASPGGGSGLTEVYWTDSGTTLSPKTAGRDVALGAGDVSATDGTFSGDVSAVDGTFSGDVTAANLPTNGSIVGYQQGEWTPSSDVGTLGFSGAEWSRNGNVVTITANLDDFSDTTTATPIWIIGLPYPKTQFASGTTGSLMSSRVNYTPGFTTSYVVTDASGPRVMFFGAAASPNASWVLAQHSNLFDQASAFIFQISYLTDDTTWTPSNGATVS